MSLLFETTASAGATLLDPHADTDTATAKNTIYLENEFVLLIIVRYIKVTILDSYNTKTTTIIIRRL